MAQASASDLEEQVTAILARQALRDPGALRPSDRLADLGLDSLGLVEVIFALEEAFDISVPFNANEPDAAGLDLSTVGAVIAAVDRLLAERAG